jgi:hypothetical protein
LPRLVAVGERPRSVGVGLRRLTALEEVAAALAALVAVMVRVFGEGRVAGAV